MKGFNRYDQRIKSVTQSCKFAQRFKKCQSFQIIQWHLQIRRMQAKYHMELWQRNEQELHIIEQIIQDYLSPELWRDQPYSYPSDIWSLGCVIYEMAILKSSFRATLKPLKPSFRATILKAGLYEKPLNQYSQELNFMIASLLKVPRSIRFTYEQILNDSTIKKYIDEFDPQSSQQQKLANAQLFQTILLPQNLKQLQQKLPKLMYDIEQPIQQDRKVILLNVTQYYFQQTNTKTQNTPSSNSNL